MSEALQRDECPPLSESQAALLDFERDWTGGRAMREQEIRARFDLSLPRYYQLLNQLIDSPAALRHDPLLVKRLRRLREQRQRARSAARLPR
ncbi:MULTISPECIES: DUF3263 domain-containing protein [unclassified Luteococcus]|uniref:DUF3263 domain-containing protein n=1 Tax=unclassified Luteococcus TaxID=2639923 RepID=UPI00313E52E9